MRKDSQARLVANQARILQIAAGAASDLDALALLFEAEGLSDDGSVWGRLEAILAATERRFIPGLQTALPFGDSGFKGDRERGGSGFRDPWPSSRNQVGHFLTALRLCCAPQIVSRPIPVLGSIRAIVGAPSTMSDAEVALRLAIGHEKKPDPRTAIPALLRVAASGGGAFALGWALQRRAGTRLLASTAATAVQGIRQAVLILGMFRAQFGATTTADLEVWEKALCNCGDLALDPRAVEGPACMLDAIEVGDGEGNSRQDLRLTFVGWRLGQLIASGALADRAAVGRWIRAALSQGPLPAVGPRDLPKEPPAPPIVRWTGRRPHLNTVALAHAIIDTRTAHRLVAVSKKLLPPERVRLTQYQIELPALPPELDGLRVLHVSDLHVHPGSDLAWQIPDLLVDVTYDLLCYTGDFIDTDDDIPGIVPLLERMPNRAAFAVLGNHDHIPHGRARSLLLNDSARLRAVLAEVGITVLSNEATPLFDGALYLVGVDDPASGRDNLDHAFAHVPRGACNVLLAHTPDIVLRLRSHRPHLILSGHTHGGQIRLPFVGAVVTMSRLPRRLVSGLGCYRDIPLFVSRGVGYSGLNVRLGSPAEVALLTLRRSLTKGLV